MSIIAKKNEQFSRGGRVCIRTHAARAVSVGLEMLFSPRSLIKSFPFQVFPRKVLRVYGYRAVPVVLLFKSGKRRSRFSVEKGNFNKSVNRV